MVWTMRPDSTLDFLNQTCMTFSGRSIETLIDDGWLDAVHPDDRDRFVGIYVPAVEAQAVSRGVPPSHADGSYRWLLATGVRTNRTAVFLAISAATWISPSGRTPKIGFARARRHWRRVIKRFLASLSEFERSRIQERVRAGLARVRAQGRRLGRKPCAVTDERFAAVANLLTRQAAQRLGVSHTLVARWRAVNRTPSGSDPRNL